MGILVRRYPPLIRKVTIASIAISRSLDIIIAMVRYI